MPKRVVKRKISERIIYVGGRRVNSMAGATRNLPFPLPVGAARCAAARIAGACPRRAEVGAAAKDEVRLFLLLIQGKNRCPLGPRAARTQLCRAPSRSVIACFCREFAGKHVPVEKGILRLNLPGSMYPAPGRLWLVVLYLFYHVRASRGGTKKCLPPAGDRLRRVAPARRF